MQASAQDKSHPSDFLMLQCQAFVKSDFEVEFKFSLPNKEKQPRVASLYVYHRNELPEDWLVIDTSKGEKVIENTLKFPIHTLKYKKYLLGKRLLLLGDGKNYTVLEQGAINLQKHIVKGVKIYHGGVDAWLQNVQNAPAITAKSLLPSEFIIESKLGRWKYIETEEELNNLVIRFQQANRKINLLDRFLLLKPELLSKVDPPASLISALFQIDGGIKALERYTEDQGIIISAKKAKQLKEQCKVSYES